MSSGRKFWGWGVMEADFGSGQKKEVVKRMEGLFDLSGLEVGSPPALEEIDMPEPKITPPESLRGISTTDRWERAAHTYGKGFPDYSTGLRARL